MFNVSSKKYKFCIKPKYTDLCTNLTTSLNSYPPLNFTKWISLAMFCWADQVSLHLSVHMALSPIYTHCDVFFIKDMVLSTEYLNPDNIKLEVPNKLPAEINWKNQKDLKCEGLGINFTCEG